MCVLSWEISLGASDMTRESIKNSFVHRRKSFPAETLAGGSDKITPEPRELNADVIFIREELGDTEAGMRVPGKARLSHSSSAGAHEWSSKPRHVVNLFCGGIPGGFDQSRSLRALTPRARREQIWTGNKDLERLIHALTDRKPIEFDYSEEMPLLSRREKDVARLVADGLEDREIAQGLNLKERSIRVYLHRIFEKLGVSSRVELILYACSRRGN